MPRYFAYCRKSTEEEDRQVLSIESQTQELRRHAEKENLHVVEFLQEAKSAKMPGRPIFDAMLKRIAKGEADGILAWHPDRLARNSLDGGRIIHFLDTGKLTSLRFPTYTFENTPQGKFMLAIMFGQSKYYVDSLSENVRRGNRTKREKGWLPNMAPIGYLNARSEDGGKIIAPDAERFPLLKKLWELFLTGAYSLPQLLELATHQMGLRTLKRRRKGGNPLSHSGLHSVFINPFYAGYIVHEGRWYQGKHKPLVTMEQFEQAQRLLGRKGNTRPKRYEFAYTGLIRCGACGYAITAENKRNRYGYRYVYYHCTHKNHRMPCRGKSLENNLLENQILGFLDTVYLDDQEIQEIFSLIERKRQKEQSSASGVKQSVEKALQACQRNLDNLTRLRYRDLITDEEFIRQRSELDREREKLKQRLEQLRSEKWIEPSRRLFQFSNRAKFWLLHGTIAEKRLIVSTVGSNPRLTDKKLNIDAKKPFRILSQRASYSDLCTIVKEVRTFFETEPGFEIPELPEPRIETVAT